MSSSIFEPGDVAGIVEVVRAGDPLVVVGGASQPDLVRAERAGRLQLGGLRGIEEYLPEEYTVTAQAGTPLADVEAALREHGQYLPFDAPYVADGATVGGAVAAGLNGPGRARYGGLRDFVLGVRMVDGRGRVVRGGGKVVKNAAGFDLPKLMVGSCGALGVLTEVTFKVFPAPQEQATVTWQAETLAEALELHRSVLLSGLQLDGVALDQRGRVSARVGGRADAIEARLARLCGVVDTAAAEELREDRDAAHWAQVRDQRADAGGALLRVPVALEQLADLVALLERICTSARSRWTLSGGAQVWVQADHHELAPLAGALSGAGLQAQVLAGPSVGRLHDMPSPLEGQLRSVLDPGGLFVSPGLAPLAL